MKKVLVSVFALLFSFSLVSDAEARRSKKNRSKSVIEEGKMVTLNYQLTIDDKLLESTDKNGPIEFTVGNSQILPGLEQELMGLKKGEEKFIILSPEKAFGQPNPKAFIALDKAQFPKDLDLKVGNPVQLNTPQGTQLVRVADINDKAVVIDANHPLAGKWLYYKVMVADIKDAPMAK